MSQSFAVGDGRNFVPYDKASTVPIFYHTVFLTTVELAVFLIEALSVLPDHWL